MKLFLEYFFWPLLKFFWEPFSKKRSHWWHWEDFKLELCGDDVVTVSGDPKALPRSNFWSNFFQTNFGWKKVVLFNKTQDWNGDGCIRAGFSCSNERKQQICQFPLPNDAVVGLLVGPHTMAGFLVDENGNQIPVVCSGICNKKDLPKDVILL